VSVANYNDNTFDVMFTCGRQYLSVCSSATRL